MEKIREKWETLSPRTKFITQIIVGLILAAGSGFFIFSSGEDENSFTPMLIALALALIVPNILEKQLETTLPILKRALIIGLAAVIVIAIILAVTSGKAFTN